MDKVWDDISYPFPNFNDAAVQVLKWKRDFFPMLTEHMITYSKWVLTHWGLVTPFGDIDLGQHWLT